MKNKKSIVLGCVITVAVIVWLIISMVFGTVLNNYLSTFKKMKSEGDNIINYYSAENNQPYELDASDTLVLPLHFDRQMFRIGIYVGGQLGGTGDYDFQIEDEFGNVLGKTVVGIEKIQPHSFVYVNIEYGVISLAQTYYLKIFAVEPDAENNPLRLIVSYADDFQTTPFSVNEVESDKTVILDYRYSAVDKSILVIIDMLLSAVVAFYWVVFVFQGVSNEKKVKIQKIVRDISWKKINIYAIGILVILNILIILMPQKSYMGVLSNERFDNFKESVISLNNDVIEQCIKMEEGINIDSFAVMFATYGKTVHDGIVYVELWDESNNQIIYSDEVKTDKIIDNKYYYFNLSEPMNFEKGDIVIKLQAKLLSENDVVAVYLNDSYSETMFAEKNATPIDGSIIFKLCKSIKQQRVNLFIIVDYFLLMVLFVYVLNFVKFRKEISKYISIVIILTLLLYPLVCSLTTYREISMNSMAAVLKKQNKFSKFRQYDEDELSNALVVEKTYNYIGEEYEHREYWDIPFNGTLSSISLEIDGDKILNKDFNIQIYWDSGEGFNDTQMYNYKYIHRGGDSIAFPVPCNDIVGKLRINVSEIFDYYYSESLIPVQKVCINLMGNSQDKGVNALRNIIIILGVVTLGTVICIWNYCRIDERLSAFSIKKKITVSKCFAIIALIYGLLMSFLIPTYQAIDEGTHINMLYDDLGDSEMAEKLDNVLNGEGELDILRLTGQSLDISTYISASRNKLENYSFHYKFPSIRVMRRPGQAIGVMIGQFFHMPAYWILQCGELGALVVYIMLGIITLNLIPYKKNLMMAIMLLPIVIQQAGSISYDSFTNAVAFLMIAYILYLKAEAKKVSWVQIVKILGLTIPFLICKIVYVLLIGLVFTIPIEKFELKVGKITINSSWLKKHKIAAIIFVLIGIPVCMISTVGLLVALGYGNILNRISEIIMSFPQFVRLLFKSISIHGKGWIEGTICILGWFDVPVNGCFIWMTVASLFVFAFMHHKQQRINACVERTKYVFRGFDVIVFYIIFILTFVAINMAMLPHGFLMLDVNADNMPFSKAIRLLPRIEGVQGRYFLPILPLLFIPLHTKKDALKFISSSLYKICYYLVVIIYPILLLLARYWGIGMM